MIYLGTILIIAGFAVLALGLDFDRDKAIRQGWLDGWHSHGGTILPPGYGPKVDDLDHDRERAAARYRHPWVIKEVK